jgi:hypothetical protein
MGVSKRRFHDVGVVEICQGGLRECRSSVEHCLRKGTDARAL